MNSPIPKKSLGQHWLHDAASLQAMCHAAAIGADDTVLEIGPGLGTLTEFLVEQAKQVVAVEFDHELAVGLPGRVPAANLSVTESDILRFDFGTLPPDYKIVANIPYYLTSNLVRVISETPNRPAKVALLVQKEVAERIAAEPGQMSLLSVSAQFYWKVQLHELVPAALFTPPPKVDSQIVSLARRGNPLYPDANEKQFFRIVKAGFSQKRKTLLNSLSGGLALSKDDTRTLLGAAKISPNARAQTLSLDDWHRLYLQVVAP
ncbi:MAG TPA: 16S rRNA (adenine(1518)-N(6)/adenine(1519)-N(6))-dimethyltransferase RsmA [Candidatus Saccharimonadales bacterium]|nr:16S rRNA (adenine(1518)-N(6)/adenine(1519)-N(6))-dimethyltransferase RsmA [Candidatus Saccharimonadales bacterium]